MNDLDLSPLVALVVDDHESSRYLVGSWLDRAGFIVLAAGSGSDGLNVVFGQHIDIVILDVNLPDMSGFEVCEAIRANPETESMPVVHVSATAVEPKDRSEGLLRGADAYLTEPVEPREFLAIVAALLRRAHMRRRALRTAARLRALNSASADAHAASNERRVLEALVNGASNVSERPAMLIARLRSQATLWRQGSAPIYLDAQALPAVELLLEPARLGKSLVSTADRALVDSLHVGVTFADESGEPLGVILVPSPADSADDELLPLLAQLAITGTLALANLRALDVEHRIAITLQRSLLPEMPPARAGVTIAFRYVAASAHAQVGGDFYEAFSLDENRTAIAIGDVVGHSLQAATVMGEIRHAIRAYAIDGYDPEDVIDRLDRLIKRFHPREYTSAVYGVIDVQRREFIYCNAGHLPFVAISNDIAQLVTGNGTLLGLNQSVPSTSVIRMPFGGRVLMVTDGLIERRTESIDAGLERLRTASATYQDISLDDALDRLLADVGPGLKPEDDIAIIGFEID